MLSGGYKRIFILLLHLHSGLKDDLFGDTCTCLDRLYPCSQPRDECKPHELKYPVLLRLAILEIGELSSPSHEVWSKILSTASCGMV